LYNIFVIIHLNNAYDDVRVPPEHVQVIICDIKRESVEKLREVQNEPISRKKLRISP
jgi:hypothetical protein